MEAGASPAGLGGAGMKAENPQQWHLSCPHHRTPMDLWHRKLPATRLWSCQHSPSPRISPNHLVLPWFSPSLGGLDTAGGQDGEQRSNHHPPLPLSKLKKVQIAELACHEINKPTEKKKQKSKEGGFLPCQGTPHPSSWSHLLCPSAHKGATLTPQMCQSPGSA